MFHACRTVREGYRIDYVKLRDLLAEGRMVLKSYFFTSAAVPARPQQEEFYDLLRREGFRVITKPLKNLGGEWREKGLDVALVTEMLLITFNNGFDAVVLISGDADYVDALRAVSQLGKRVEVASFLHTTAPDIRLVADRFIVLDYLTDELELGSTS